LACEVNESVELAAVVPAHEDTLGVEGHEPSALMADAVVVHKVQVDALEVGRTRVQPFGRECDPSLPMSPWLPVIPAKRSPVVVVMRAVVGVDCFPPPVEHPATTSAKAHHPDTTAANRTIASMTYS